MFSPNQVNIEFKATSNTSVVSVLFVLNCFHENLLSSQT